MSKHQHNKVLSFVTQYHPELHTPGEMVPDSEKQISPTIAKKHPSVISHQCKCTMYMYSDVYVQAADWPSLFFFSFFHH